LTLPPSLQRVILEFIGTELSAGRVDLELRLAQANSIAEDLATENERLAIQIDVLLNDVESLQSEKSMLEGRFSELETTLCSTREEAVRERQAAESARTELAKLALRLEAMPRLEAELAEIRKDCHAVDRRRQEVERDLAVAKSESQLLEQSRSDLIRSLEARLSETQEQLRMAVTQLREVQEERLKATAELAMAQASRANEGAKAAERIGKLEGALTAMEKVGNLQPCPM
jgi:chromosome segregation ATPase